MYEHYDRYERRNNQSNTRTMSQHREHEAAAEIVKFRSDNGLLLTGLLFCGANAETTIIHIHGAGGNFLSATFLPTLAHTCVAANVNLFSINTSGQACMTEAFRHDSYVYVGGAVSRFEECVADINGALKKAREFSRSVVLQGHSLGCDRVVHFCLESEQHFPLILLSPCDSYRLQQLFIAPESVESQIERMRARPVYHEFELLPANEYGIKNKGEEYQIPVSRNTFLSISDGPPFKLFRQEQPMEYYVDTECLVAIGKEDDLQTCSPNDMFRLLESRFRSVRRLVIDDADHDFDGKAKELSQHIIEWVDIVTKQCRH